MFPLCMVFSNRLVLAAVGIALGTCYVVLLRGSPFAGPQFIPLALPHPQSSSSLVLNRGYFDYSQVWADVYSSLPGYAAVCPMRPGECWLPLRSDVNCRSLFQQYLHVLRTYKPMFPPPKAIRPEALNNFTLAQHVLLKSHYIAAASYAPNAAVPVWTQAVVDDGIAKARAAAPSFGTYGVQVRSMYNALRCHKRGVEGLRGAVFGSQNPWLESVFLAYGAAHITTIEYRPTVSQASAVAVMNPRTWAEGWLNGTVVETDFAASFSSFEHDGLGRYGDPMNAWGDVSAMQRASCYVKAGGLMFLAVPMCAKDELVFNAHRIYGRVRWPLLASNWQVLGVFLKAWEPECKLGCFDQLWPRVQDACRTAKAGFIQPVVVLKNMRSSPCR